MNKIYLILLMVSGFLGFSGPVFAHTGVLPADGLGDGFMHPFLGLDHTLVMLGVGLWAATHRLAVAGQIVAVFLLYMLAGALLGLSLGLLLNRGNACLLPRLYGGATGLVGAWLLLA